MKGTCCEQETAGCMTPVAQIKQKDKVRLVDYLLDLLVSPQNRLSIKTQCVS
jgi:hypothetical protein